AEPITHHQKTYSTKDSRVVTRRSTDMATRSLTMGERTGSLLFFNLWPYVAAFVQRALGNVVAVRNTSKRPFASRMQVMQFGARDTRENPFHVKRTRRKSTSLIPSLHEVINLRRSKMQKQCFLPDSN
ncbi:hypothetical protein BJ508DRAFT_218279, partial [Ascobolus immersus RN42]